MQDTLNAIEARRTLGNVRFTVACIPPDIHSGWSLKDIYSQEALDRDPAFKTRLGTALAGYAGSTVYAPSVAYHSGEIVLHPRRLNQRITFPNGITMYRNKGIRADGVFMERGQSFAMSSAGCMLVVAVGTTGCGESYMIPFHASRDSMLDRKRIEHDEASRPYESVVGTVVEALKNRGIDEDHIAIRGYFSLPWKSFEHPFEHPEYGEYNVKMAAYVASEWGASCVCEEDTDEGQSAFLNIHQLLYNQADKLGVKDVKCEHTLKLSGPFAHTRHPIERLRNERNLCIVHRSR